MYLLSAGSISQNEIHEIEGRLAQHGIELTVVLSGSLDYLAIVSDPVWDGKDYAFKLTKATGEAVDLEVVGIVKERLAAAGYRPHEDSDRVVVTLSAEDQPNPPILAVNRIRWLTTTTLNFLYSLSAGANS